MDFRFGITCQACGCQTELATGVWTAKQQFQCPNCGTIMPHDFCASLAQAALALAVVPSIPGFSIQIKQE